MQSVPDEGDGVFVDFLDSLLKNHLFLMSLTVGLGIFVGKISVRGINLGISGALFVGLFIGAWGYTVPNDYFTWNLMFFVVAEIAVSLGRNTLETPTESCIYADVMILHAIP